MWHVPRTYDDMLVCSQQLEYLEDKLRELRFVAPESSADQKSVLLGQLDSVRRELVEALYAQADKVVSAKDILREILNFALGEDEENGAGTPKPKGSRFLSSESTPRGKRTPAVPDSLEGNHGRRWASPESAKMDRSSQSTPATQWTDDELRSNQRKYSTYSRTLMVSDEDIYGPKETRKTPDTQGYGGTIKVKELLAKAEQGLTDVVTAQSERRSAPRERDHDHAGMNVGSPVPWEHARMEDAMAESTRETGILTTKTKYAAPWKGESRGLGSISPDAKFGSGSQRKRAEMNAARLRIDSRYGDKKGGVAVAIGKIASLAVLVGGIAAGALAITLAANRHATPTMRKNPVRSQKKTKSKKKKKPVYRGEADVYTIIEDESDESVYVAQKSEWEDEHGEQAPVMNVHKPPASENFPSSPPDVTVAMG